MGYPVDEWIELYLHGKNLNEIGELYGLSFATVGRFIKEEFQISSVKHLVHLYFRDEVVALYIDYELSSHRIAELLNLDQRKIVRILKSEGVSIRKYRPTEKYSCNIDYFEKIDCDHVAYWLGFIYADGCISLDKGKKVFSIAQHDDEKLHLYKLRYCLKSNHRIGSDGRKCHQLRIHNKKLIIDLEGHGVVERKSEIVRFPYASVPERFYSSFIRGYFDGDGSLNFHKTGTALFNICSGSKGMLEDIRSILIDALALNKNKITKSNRTYNLQYGGNIQVSRIRDWLYKEADVCMDRKKEDFDQVEYEKVEWIELRCPACGDPFERLVSETQQSRGGSTGVTCCSKDCYKEFHSRFLRGIDSGELSKIRASNVIRKFRKPRR